MVGLFSVLAWLSLAGLFFGVPGRLELVGFVMFAFVFWVSYGNLCGSKEGDKCFICKRSGLFTLHIKVLFTSSSDVTSMNDLFSLAVSVHELLFM